MELGPLNGTGPLYTPGTKLAVKLVPMGGDRPVGKHAASGVLFALDAAGNWCAGCRVVVCARGR